MTALVEDAALDFYPTPGYVTRGFLDDIFARTMRPAPAKILEPCAGDGAMVHELRRTWPSAQLDAFDVQPQDQGREGIEQRAFWFDEEPGGYDLVFTNPPFSLALQFAQYCLAKRNHGGTVVLLLPMAFWESRERFEFNRMNMPHHVYPLHERISFTKDGKTDSRQCGWFVWRENNGRGYTTRVTLL